MLQVIELEYCLSLGQVYDQSASSDFWLLFSVVLDDIINDERALSKSISIRSAGET